MFEYELRCAITVTVDNKFLVSAEIFRSNDGETFNRVAKFEQKIKSTLDDSVIMAGILKRFQDFCSVDMDAIEKADLTTRASTIEGAVDGQRYIP